ncbi:Prolyl-tRNA synthetase 2, partial [mine drainage metagenome]
DGLAIQGPDFHYDGQKFSKAFDISFINKDGKKENAYQNTWAITTREIGVMIMMHGDNKGLVIPPKVARKQVVIVPIYNDSNKIDVIRYAEKVKEMLDGACRVYIDSRDEYSPGWKFNEWEMKGTPIRIEAGQREMDQSKIVAVMRHNGEKESIDIEKVKETIPIILERIHNDLYKKAVVVLQAYTHKAESYDELKGIIENGGFAQAPWCGSEECEANIKKETGAKATNMPD